MTQPLFSSLKTKVVSFHSAVGKHTSYYWFDYSLVTVTWSDGHSTRHLQRVGRINGQLDTSSQYGATDTERLLREFGCPA